MELNSSILSPCMSVPSLILTIKIINIVTSILPIIVWAEMSSPAQSRASDMKSPPCSSSLCWPCQKTISRFRMMIPLGKYTPYGSDSAGRGKPLIYVYFLKKLSCTGLVTRGLYSDLKNSQKSLIRAKNRVNYGTKKLLQRSHQSVSVMTKIQKITTNRKNGVI